MKLQRQPAKANLAKLPRSGTAPVAAPVLRERRVTVETRLNAKNNGWENSHNHERKNSSQKRPDAAERRPILSTGAVRNLATQV